MKTRGKWVSALLAMIWIYTGCPTAHGQIYPTPGSRSTGTMRSQPMVETGDFINPPPGRPMSGGSLYAPTTGGQVRTAYPMPGNQPPEEIIPVSPIPSEGGPAPRVIPQAPIEMLEGPGMTGPGMMGPGHPGPGFCPRELTPVSHPPYTVGPTDILFMDAIRMVPKAPYRIEPLEVLMVTVSDTLPNQPINGPVVVSPDGMINLGFGYGSVKVGGLTLEQAQTAIRNHLSQIIRNPQVVVQMLQFRGLQQIRGLHLVRPDGTISLGTYGSVYVAGFTLGQIKCEVEKHLGHYLEQPQVSVDVYAYNSKVYYVIYDGGGFGQQIFRLPATGNDYVLDAIGYLNGLAPVSSKRRIWLARPAPGNLGCNQILPVDWAAITQAGDPTTNYQLFPGDRIYVGANRLIEFDNYLSMVLNPIERILGVTLLGTYTVSAIKSVGFIGTGTGTGFVPGLIVP